jgi:hypothetical protein
MGIGRVHSNKKVLAQLLLLALPTAVVIGYLLFRLNIFYAILENNWLTQDLYFTGGMVIATLFYAFRFRFVTTSALIFFVCFVVYKLLGSVSFGEFDAFYFSVQFLIFFILFATGWIAGFGLSRSRYFTIAWSVLLLVIQIIVVSKTTDIKVSTMVNAFAPFLAYAFYIIYTSELIRNMNENETRFKGFIVKRLAGFSAVLLILFLVLFNAYKSEFKAIEKEWGGGNAPSGKGDAKGETESMTKRDGKGGVSNKDQTRLSGSLNKEKQLVFVARLENYFPDGRTPNPLYFTSCYYTKFDTATQTFETDPDMPYNDLFSPDPSTIPLYFSKTNSTVIKNSLSTLDRKVVTAEIYNVNLSANTFLAPSTAFYCQPISVPKEFKKQFRSAFHAKMWVSDLNSAYFIYNPADNYSLAQFQELRFEKLRQFEKLTGPDDKFMKYYTFMPRDDEYKKISELAQEVTKDAVMPIDKIIAIRDYFLSKDEFGQPLFKYSDNPGVPGIPSANKLTYFLLENRKGYCAYFAGATLFMLRSLGIPSRLVAGFSTVDRSTVNPGWYWFYQDQAHAWVQVYFPDYGWIDFDTTIPDLNTQQAPQPDGTPPLNLPQTFLVADGEATAVDTSAKKVTMQVKKLLYHDKDYSVNKAKDFLMDVSMASFTTDTGEVNISYLKKGMHITAVSHAEVFKELKADDHDDLVTIIDKLPKPAPIDEIKITLEEDVKKDKEKKDAEKAKPIDWINVLEKSALTLLVLGVLLFMSPWLIWIFLNARARRSSDKKAYYAHSASLYYLNQLGYHPKGKGPEQFAYMIDQKFGTGLSQFNSSYQKLKYSRLPLNETEKQNIHNFYPAFIKKIKSQIPLKERVKRFLNIYTTIHYFSKSKSN